MAYKARTPTQDQLDKTYAVDENLGLPRGTISRQITRESQWDPNATGVGPGGKQTSALGFGQFIDKTWANIESATGRSLDRTNFDDALTGIQHLWKENLRRFGNPEDAGRAYYAGTDRTAMAGPEASSYVTGIFGGAAPASPDGAVNPFEYHPKPDKEPAMSKLAAQDAMQAEQADLTRQQAQAANAAEGGPGGPVDYTSAERSNEQSGQAIAATTHQLGGVEGFAETIAQTASWDWVTGDIARRIKQGEATPNYEFTPEHLDGFKAEAPNVWADNQMRQYVLGAVSDEDYAVRVQYAKDHVDFEQKYANTGGAFGFSLGATRLATGMLDPVTLAATMGTGSVLNSARVASLAARGVQATRLGTVAFEAGVGAAGNVAVEVGMRSARNQDLEFPALFQQAMLGAALGGLGGMFGKLEQHPIEAGAADQAQRRLQDTLNNPHDATLHTGGDGTVGMRIDEVPVDNFHGPRTAEEMKVREAEEMLRAEDHHTTGMTDEQRTGRVKEAEDVLREEKEMAAAGGTYDRPKLDNGELTDQGFEHGGTVANDDHPVEHQTFQHNDRGDMDRQVKRSLRGELQKVIDSDTDGLRKVLAQRIMDGLGIMDAAVNFGEGILKRRARGEYDPADHQITLAKKHLDATGQYANVLLHEGAHALSLMKLHWGKLNPHTAHGRIYAELDALRKQALDAYKGSDFHTGYHLTDVHEFVSGLFSGKDGDFLRHLASLEAGPSIIAKMFDAVRRLLGFDASETSVLARAMNLSDELIDTPLNTTLHRTDGRDFSVRQSAMPPTGRFEPNAGKATQTWVERIAGHTEKRGPASEKIRELYRKKNWLTNNTLGKVLPDGVRNVLDSVGMTLATSTSKGVRYVASLLAEDPTGMNRQHAASAALDVERLRAGFREPFIRVYNDIVPKLLQGKEMAAYKLGRSGDIEKRIGLQVAEYRLAKRNARLANVEFNVSTYDPHIVSVGDHLDGYWGNIHEAAKATGEEVGTALGGKGFQGHMPYNWDWAKIHRTFNEAKENPAQWNSLVQLFRDQYTGKVVEPAIADAVAKGVDPAEIMTLREQLNGKVEHLVGNYLEQVSRDPASRVKHAENHFKEIGLQLLDQWRGEKLTLKTVADIRAKLKSIVDDRTRTEFDLLASHEGVRMLDFMDTDIGRMVDNSSQRFAGNIALARRGLGTPAERDGMMGALRRDGASGEDLKNIDFLVRSLTGDLNPDEAGAARLMQQTAYMTMMGKMGFNALADAAGMITLTGVGGMFKALGRGFLKNDATRKALEDFAPGLFAHDPRLFNQTVEGAVGTVDPTSLVAEGSRLATFGQTGVQAVGVLSGMHHVSKMLHNGFIPMFTEDLLKTIRSGEGISAERMGDLGLSPERIAGIREQLNAHSQGGALNLDKWDVAASDDLVAAVQRGTGQVLQRAYIGETPKWLSETTHGKIFAQFRRFGWLAAEKQTMRNLGIADRNTASMFAVGTAMASAVYAAKSYANTGGMSDKQRDAYLQKAFAGPQALSGMLILFNGSGMAADAADMTTLFLGGTAHGQSAPVAAVGALMNAKGAFSAVGGALVDTLQGDGTAESYQKQVRNGMRIVPGANTLLGTAISNGLNTTGR